MTQLRPSQTEILKYHRGKMGIAAVPGSGKTFTLSLLAAQIISSGVLINDQEVLIVTLVNSAVDNFYQQVSSFIQKQGLLPNTGYRVRTLHGLAHDILRERPSLVGLDERFQIVDQRESLSILDDAAHSWLKSHPAVMLEYLAEDLEEGKVDYVMRKKLPELVSEIVLAVVRMAKDRRLSPEKLRQRIDEIPFPVPLAEMGCQVYADYQQALAYRGAVDFDDLIRLSLGALESDTGFLDRLRLRWPFILEDEAQDSSRLQEQILSLLAGEQGNWVRVGDPNQAIFETFTTASPRFLRQFILRPDVRSLELPGSGRSTTSIIQLANQLVSWTQTKHLIPEVHDALQSPPLIEPVGASDPNPNPPDDPSQVHLVLAKNQPAEEIKQVVESIRRWLPEHPGWTVAALVPSQARGIELVEQLRWNKIPFEDSLLASSSQTRLTVKRLQTLLEALSNPLSIPSLSAAFQAWGRQDESPEEQRPWLDEAASLILKCPQVEDFLWPGTAGDWLESLAQQGAAEQNLQVLQEFRSNMQRWQPAVQLPVDQLVLTLSQDLFKTSSELALAHKLALLLSQAAGLHPEWRLPEMVDEIKLIARNERRFIGFSSEDSGFDPDRYRDTVVVSTFHKAKGLEWDRVYLLSVNNYDFPSGDDNDQYQGEKWYIRDHLNMTAEALAQVEAVLSVDEGTWYQEGQPSLNSRLDYVRERLRLLYVGITRARRELVVTWNTGRYGDQRPSLPLVALSTYWKEFRKEAADGHS
ncbi:MAG: hypothetical protein A2Z16_08140 [Chloroflexi bacterium RBG_16_54_18]|nr:MAG: hypothetical protein A2Z16_08140 [Chloroflexi bacterium RBG_16_54_18]